MTELREFELKLHHNLQILKEREAQCGNFAAPVFLINQIEDYQKAIKLTEQALKGNISAEELQAEFVDLNLDLERQVQFKPIRKKFTGQNPYRGLEKFTENDAEFFFGRNSAIEELILMTNDIIKSETTPKNPALLVVVGASGSGKSSLVRAGFIPRLQEGVIPGSDSWPIRVMVPGHHPLNALAAQFKGLLNRGAPIIREELNSGLDAFHLLLREAMSDKPEDGYYILVIDQFEELFTLCESEQERKAFIELILTETYQRDHRGLIVLTMRADFYGRALVYKNLADAVTVHQFAVSPMTSQELREAILLPAETVGLEMERDLALALIQDTAKEPGRLPLLQHALLELFNRRTKDNVMTLAAYTEIGGVQGALTHRADEVFQQLTSEQQQLARKIFIELTELGEGVSDTRRRVKRSNLNYLGAPEAIEAILQELSGKDTRLVVSGEEVEVTHEALIQQWGQLRDWLDEDRESIRIHRRLNSAAKEWQEHKQDKAYLYIGSLLAQAEEWAKFVDNLSPIEQGFLKASLAEREQAVREKEEQHQRELEQARKLQAEAEARQLAEEERAQEAEARAKDQMEATTRQRKLTRIMAGIGMVAIIAAVVASISFFYARASEQNAIESEQAANEAKATALANEAKANRQATISQAQLWASEGQRLFETMPRLGLQLALEGWNNIQNIDTDTRDSLENIILDQAQQGRLDRFDLADVKDIHDLIGLNPVALIKRRSSPDALYDVANGTVIPLTGSIYDKNSSPLIMDAATDIYSGGHNFESPFYVISYEEEDIFAELRRRDDPSFIKPLRSNIVRWTKFSSDPESSYLFITYPSLDSELRRTVDGSLVPLNNLDDVYFGLDRKATYFLALHKDGVGELCKFGNELCQPLPDKVRSVSLHPDPQYDDDVDTVGRYFLVNYKDNETPAEMYSAIDGSKIASLPKLFATSAAYSVKFYPNSPFFWVTCDKGGTWFDCELRRVDDPSFVEQFDESAQVYEPYYKRGYLIIEQNDTLEIRRITDNTPLVSLPAANILHHPDQVDMEFDVAFTEEDYVVVSHEDDVTSKLLRMSDGKVIFDDLPGKNLASLKLVHISNPKTNLLLITQTSSSDKNPETVQKTTEMRFFDGPALYDLFDPYPITDIEFFYYGEKRVPFFMVSYEGGLKKLHRASDGSEIDLKGKEVKERDGVDFELTFDKKITPGVFIINYTDGSSELRRYKDGELIEKLKGVCQAESFDNELTTFQYEDGSPAELRRISDGSLVSNYVGMATFFPENSPTMIFLGVNFKDSSWVRTSDAALNLDGIPIENLSSDKIEKIALGPEPYFIVRYVGDIYELWSAEGGPHRLAELGRLEEKYHFASYIFYEKQDRFVFWRSDGEAYLLDLSWLSDMAGQANKMPIEDLIKLVCNDPFKDYTFSIEEKTKLQSVMGENYSLQVCK